MTAKWGEIKKKLEEEGLTDDSEVNYIDLSFDMDSIETIKVKRLVDNTWEIY